MQVTRWEPPTGQVKQLTKREQDIFLPKIRELESENEKLKKDAAIIAAIAKKVIGDARDKMDKADFEGSAVLFAELTSAYQAVVNHDRSGDGKSVEIPKALKVEQPAEDTTMDSAYADITALKNQLTNLFEKDLKPSEGSTYKTITDRLENLTEKYSRLKQDLAPLFAKLTPYISSLREWIDFCEKNEINPTVYPSIALYEGFNQAMITSIQNSPLNIEKVVEAKTEEVNKKESANRHTVSTAKERHDKFLKQLIETKELCELIALRLNKLDHLKASHPTMLLLSDDSNELNTKLFEGTKLLGNTSLFLSVKNVFTFLISYHGKNPLFDEEYPDLKFKDKLEKIEQNWKKTDFDPLNDTDFKGFKNNTTPLPQAGLLERAVAVEKSVEMNIAQLEKYLATFTDKYVLDGIYGAMKFYNHSTHAEVTKKTVADLDAERQAIRDILVEYKAKRENILQLFRKTLPESLDYFCSSVLTNDGKPRSVAGRGLKSFAGGNTIYARRME